MFQSHYCYFYHMVPIHSNLLSKIWDPSMGVDNIHGTVILGQQQLVWPAVLVQDACTEQLFGEFLPLSTFQTTHDYSSKASLSLDHN